jgi:O-antigen/teichoic acid export membrane protein
LQLAYGMTRLPLIINSILMVLVIPLIVIFSKMYGAMGGAMAWACLNILYFFLGTNLTHRHLLKNKGLRWIVNDVGIPVLVVLMIGFLINILGQYFDYSVYARLMVGFTGAVLLICLGILSSAEIKLLFSRGLNDSRVS